MKTATDTKKPTDSERAISAEKPKHGERATVPEKPTSAERANISEKPILKERANVGEKPTENERAIETEKPSRHERIFTTEQMESIRIFTRCYYDYQEERTALDGQLGLKKDGEAKKGRPDRDPALLMILMERRDGILKMEETMEKDIAKLIHKHPLWINFLRDVKGCGEMMTAVIVTQFDIRKGETVSKLWQFSGMNPGQIHGKVWKKKGGERTLVATEDMIRGDKKVKGFVCPFNSFLKAKLLGVLGSSFLKCGSPYRVYYDNMKHRLESKDWGTASKKPTDPLRPKAGHQHKAANRYMVKQFLKDLYVAWRTVEGLPVRAPYEEEYLGKKHSAV